MLGELWRASRRKDACCYQLVFFANYVKVSIIFLEENLQNVMHHTTTVPGRLVAEARRPQLPPMPTAEQIRAARALLGWSAAELARRARVSATTIVRCERGPGIPRVQIGTLEKVRQTLEDAGVEFTGGNGPGVRLRRRP